VGQRGETDREAREVGLMLNTAVESTTLTKNVDLKCYTTTETSPQSSFRTQ